MNSKSGKLKNKSFLQLVKDNRGFVFFSVCLFLAFALLAYLFPYTGDDWSWGSDTGMTRLENFFDNYNGRYFGNLLVMALTRNRVLRASVVGISYYLCCFISYKYSAYKNKFSFLAAAILLFAMPETIFTQSLVWTAGFSNYVPSAVMTVLYILIVKNITGNEMPVYPRLMGIFTLLLGFCAALFMESVTVFNVIFGILF